MRTDLPSLPPALSATRHETSGPAGRVSFYEASPAATDLPPLLLIHSVNAAASAFEVEPLFEHYRRSRTVYALDLPGYGFSDRSDRVYSTRLMTDAVLMLVDAIAARQGQRPIDALAVSLSCEFLARAATERPAAFRSVALVSATGLDRSGGFHGPAGSTRGKPGLHRWLAHRPWSEGLFRLLTRRAVIGFFLRKTFGSPRVDPRLIDYAVATARMPGAHHAPLSFLSFLLFSADVSRLYEAIEAPVLLVHGTRGDFVKYPDAARLARDAHWTVHVMETGAMPYFEDLPGFVAWYDDFVAMRVTN